MALKKNNLKDLDDLLNKIEKYFDYRWNNNKNTAFSDDTDVSLFQQLPDDV